MRKILCKALAMVFLLFIILLCNSCYGSSTITETSIEKNVSYKLANIYNPNGNKLSSIGGSIIGVAQLLCYGSALIILMIKGVQYMVAAPEAKADIKKSMIAYGIGALLLFSVGVIITIVGNIAMNI